MSKDYGTESEIRKELDKLTTKEVIQKLKSWLYRPTEDIGIINTEQLMLERIEQELEMSAEKEALKKIVLATKEQYYCAQDELNAIERILCEYFESIGLKYWDVISGKGEKE